MRIVVDTNIVVNALRNGGTSHSKASRLMRDIYLQKYDVCVSTFIIEEYREVLSRPEIKVGWIQRSIWLIWLRLNAIVIEPLPTTQEEIHMRDEDDRIFFDVARCMKAKLITRNYRDYPIDELITLLDELY